MDRSISTAETGSPSHKTEKEELGHQKVEKEEPEPKPEPEPEPEPLPHPHPHPHPPRDEIALKVEGSDHHHHHHKSPTTTIPHATISQPADQIKGKEEQKSDHVTKSETSTSSSISSMQQARENLKEEETSSMRNDNSNEEHQRVEEDNNNNNNNNNNIAVVVVPERPRNSIVGMETRELLNQNKNNRSSSSNVNVTSNYNNNSSISTRRNNILGNDDEDDENEDEEANTPKKKQRGGWLMALLLLTNQGLQTLAFFGVGINLVLFLTRVMEQDNADAANNVSIWTGTVYLFSLIGAFLSDSYWGRYLTCAVFQGVLVLGLILLTVGSEVLLLKPKGCGDGHMECHSASTFGSVVFYIAIYLVALGYGGHQPTLATFGADQFDPSDPKGKDNIAVFFAYFYFALNVGSIFSNTLLVYFEDNGYWAVGFISALSASAFGLISYLMGSSRYRYIKASGNPLPRVAQVIVAAFRKWKVTPDRGDRLYEVQGVESAIKGSRKIRHSNEFQFLDKAATVTPKDKVTPPPPSIEQQPQQLVIVEQVEQEEEEEEMQLHKNPWRLCTVTQVEEVKCVLKMLPIWLCTIIYSVIFTQMASLFVEQGDVMDTSIGGSGSFHIPAASMTVFDILAVLVATVCNRHLIVPLARRLSGNPKGLTELHRMGVGLVVGTMAMIAAGVTEIERLKKVIPGQKKSTLSVFWQVPQYLLVGTSEVFMYVGQLEFFNTQAPDGIKSFGSSLCMASISFGNYVSSLLVKMVMAITARGENPGWIPADLNQGHMERFYFLIAALTVVDFVIFIYCAKWYVPINFDSDQQVLLNELGGTATGTPGITGHHHHHGHLARSKVKDVEMDDDEQDNTTAPSNHNHNHNHNHNQNHNHNLNHGSEVGGEIRTSSSRL